MRGTRWLLILAILAILGGVGATYRLQRRILASQAAPKPARMPLDLKSSAEDWVWTQTDNGKPKATLRARKFGQAKDTGITELEGVQLQIAGKEGDTYDIVKCEKAQFTQGDAAALFRRPGRNHPEYPGGRPAQAQAGHHPHLRSQLRSGQQQGIHRPAGDVRI